MYSFKEFLTEQKDSLYLSKDKRIAAVFAKVQHGGETKYIVKNRDGYFQLAEITTTYSGGRDDAVMQREGKPHVELTDIWDKEYRSGKAALKAYTRYMVNPKIEMMK